MDKIRRRIIERLDEMHRSQSWLSGQIGKHRGYFHDYLEKGSPRDLAYEDKLKVARVLQVNAHEFGIETGHHAASQASGFTEPNADVYTPGNDDIIRPMDNIGYFKMRDNSLDQHERRIMPGDVLAFDLTKTKASEIEAGRIVVANLADKLNVMRGRGTVMLQFIPPNKLITNSSAQNTILSIDDGPYDVAILGAFIAKVTR